jgi:hypothetical protein
MSALATAEDSRVMDLPLSLALSRPRPLDSSPVEDFAREQAAVRALYDPVEQLTRGSDTKIKMARCLGTCSTWLGGVDWRVVDIINDR